MRNALKIRNSTRFRVKKRLSPLLKAARNLKSSFSEGEKSKDLASKLALVTFVRVVTPLLV